MKSPCFFRRALAIALVAVMLLSVFACTKTPSNPADTSSENTTGGGEPGSETTEPVTGSEETSAPLETDTSENGTDAPVTADIVITVEKNIISGDEVLQFTALLSGVESKDVVWSVDNTDIVAITKDGALSITSQPVRDTFVKVVATATADSTLSGFKTILVKAPVIEGQVGELTSDMIAELGNPSITVTGTLTDYYRDVKNAANSTQHTYSMKVEMSDGAWLGTWAQEGSVNTITDVYRRGEDGFTNQNGVSGHALNKVFIDRHNKVATQLVKDYMSIPSVWEESHYWNHLGNLDVNRFTYDPETDLYGYKLNVNDTLDLYLMTYLSYSLTPMLSDTLAELYLKVEDGHIVGMTAQTEVLLYGEDTNEDPDAMSYTTFDITFSNIGTTTVADPAPYEAPEHAEMLTAALASMGDAKNYTYQVKDVTTSAPAGDEGDYSTAANAAILRAMSTSYRNYTSSVGTVGSLGYVTPEAVVIAQTGKYNYSMDGKDYFTEYMGYKQMADDTYEEFAYDHKADAFVGKRKMKGNFFDIMPTFDFSANIFQFDGLTKDRSTGRTLYTFSLIESAITREVAMQVSNYRYARDAEASSRAVFEIVVDDIGNIISTSYPYSIVGGSYTGICTTTYSNVGTTVLEEGAFDNYVPRVLKTEWSQFTMTDFYHLHSTLCSNYGCDNKDTGVYDHSAHTATADAVLRSIFGDDAEKVPTPDDMLGLFGDNLNGPFYNWRKVGTDNDGNDINHGYFSMNVSSTEYDENGKITNYEELMEEIRVMLEAKGYKLSMGNTNTTDPRNRNVTFIKDGVQIVFNNIGTRFIYIYFYQTGDWTLSGN